MERRATRMMSTTGTRAGLQSVEVMERKDQLQDQQLQGTIRYQTAATIRFPALLPTAGLVRLLRHSSRRLVTFHAVHGGTRPAPASKKYPRNRHPPRKRSWFGVELEREVEV